MDLILAVLMEIVIPSFLPAVYMMDNPAFPDSFLPVIMTALGMIVSHNVSFQSQ